MAAEHRGTQIEALTATRAVAALLVIIHHFGTHIFPFNRAPYFFSSGNIAVGYFFVLSGFVLYLSYFDKRIGYREYLVKRLARIAPVYWIALMMSVCAGVIFFHYSPGSAQALRETLLSALFLQAWVPTYPLCLNGPGWTISIEMFFYVIFPVLLLLQKRYFKVFLLLTVCFYVLSQYFHLKYYPERFGLPDEITDTIFFNPVMHLNEFMIGMLGGFIYFKYGQRLANFKWGPFTGALFIVLLIALRPANVSYHTGLIAPVFMLFVVCVASSNPTALNFRPLVYLGEISYGMYILQQPVFKILGQINERKFHISEIMFFYVSLAVLIILTALVYRFAELPLKKKIIAAASARGIPTKC